MKDIEITYVTDEEPDSTRLPPTLAGFTGNAPDYELVSPDGSRSTVTPVVATNPVANIPVTPESAVITKRKLRELKRYRKAVNQMRMRDRSKPNRLKKSRSLRDRQKASRKANRGR